MGTVSMCRQHLPTPSHSNAAHVNVKVIPNIVGKSRDGGILPARANAHEQA